MISALIAKYRGRGLLVDTNLLIGYLIGLLGLQHLKNCRATKSFSKEDFLLLRQFLTEFTIITTTPHVLTEVSNLAGKLPESLHRPFRLKFRLLIEGLKERRQSAADLSLRQDFLQFGLADSAIAAAAKGNLVLTDEFALAGFLQSQGVDVLNFNRLRQEKWGLR